MTAPEVMIARSLVKIAYTLCISLLLWIPTAYLVFWILESSPTLAVVLVLYFYPQFLYCGWRIFRNYESIPKEPLEEA